MPSALDASFVAVDIEGNGQPPPEIVEMTGLRHAVAR